MVNSTDKQKFYRLSNADGKVWLLPVNRLRTGINIYQPSSRKGKLLKLLFPALHRINAVRRAACAEVMNHTLAEDLRTMLCRVFAVEEIEYSIFYGTPSVHRKTTIQISSGNRILGYCKISDNPEVATLFRHEAQMLSFLENSGIGNIPRVLFCGDMASCGAAFVQTTTKTVCSRTKHRWTKAHTEMMQSLYRATHSELPFKQTDYFRYMNYLADNLDLLPERDREVVGRAINAVGKHYDGTVTFSAFHGDFTPWNMIFSKSKLFVFDWEYSLRTCPKDMDVIHFVLQTAIFSKQFDASLTYRCYTRFKKHSGLVGVDVDMLTLTYLVYILAFYIMRTDGYDNSYGIRMQVLKKIVTTL